MLKPKLLVAELWSMGDLVIATPFLRAASQKFSVTLVCKPAWKDLQKRFCPDVAVVPFHAPWTAFKVKDKYRLYAWPWRDLFRLRRELVRGQFDVGLSARWGDPRDHLLLALSRAKMRLGFPRWRSEVLLTHPLPRPDPAAHRFEYWRALGQAVGIDLPRRARVALPAALAEREFILLHSGAKQSVRVWPLERYRRLAERLRQNHYPVQIACDPDQRGWWLQVGEKNVTAPQTVLELLDTVDRAWAFIGNDSGPGHLAALLGVPTFTLFGPQLPEWWAPLHPHAEWIEGKPCPYKPCFDYCLFSSPHCLLLVTEAEVWEQIQPFAARCAAGNATRSEFALA